MAHALNDAEQVRVYLSEAISSVCRIHRAVLGDEAAATFAGVGVLVRIEKDLCVIMAMHQGVTPSLGAVMPHCMQVGHIIDSVDGQTVRGLAKNAVQDLLVGPVGSNVALCVRGTREGDAPYLVTLQRFQRCVNEESMRTLSERTLDTCARASQYMHEHAWNMHEQQAIRRELACMSSDLARNEEILTDSVRAREASNKLLLQLEERAKSHLTEKEGLQSQIDVLHLQLSSSKQQLIELHARHEQHVQVISHSQQKIFDLENAESALAKEKSLANSLCKQLEQQVGKRKAEQAEALVRHGNESRELETQIEALHMQLLKHSKTAALLKDAERRETSLKRSLESFEQERNSYKRESVLLSTDLKGARDSLEVRGKDLSAATSDANTARQRVNELEARVAVLQQTADQAIRDEAVLVAQLTDARFKSRLLLHAMKGSVAEWQGVGMVVRSGLSKTRPTTLRDVRRGGAAWRSGVLNDGDILVAVDGRNVSGVDVKDIQVCVLQGVLRGVL